MASQPKTPNVPVYLAGGIEDPESRTTVRVRTTGHADRPVDLEVLCRDRGLVVSLSRSQAGKISDAISAAARTDPKQDSALPKPPQPDAVVGLNAVRIGGSTFSVPPKVAEVVRKGLEAMAAEKAATARKPAA